MADVFELELHDLHEDDPNRGPDSDDDIIEIDEVSSSIFFFPCYIIELSKSTHCEILLFRARSFNSAFRLQYFPYGFHQKLVKNIHFDHSKKSLTEGKR